MPFRKKGIRSSRIGRFLLVAPWPGCSDSVSRSEVSGSSLTGGGVYHLWMYALSSVIYDDSQARAKPEYNTIWFPDSSEFIRHQLLLKIYDVIDESDDVKSDEVE